MSSLEQARQYLASGRLYQAAPHGYNISRTFNSEKQQGSSYDEYLWFENKTVTQIIQEKINELGRPVRLLDVGIGRGGFLRGVKQAFGEAVECEGVNNFSYHDPLAMEKAGVHVVIGDIQTMPLPHDYYDIVTATHSLEYTQNPLWAFKRMHTAATAGGIVFINPITMMFVDEADQHAFVSYVRDGLGFEIVGPHGSNTTTQEWTISFRKQGDVLRLPLSISDFVELTQVNFAGGFGETMKWMQARYVYRGSLDK